jgi:hypothetical protein
MEQEADHEASEVHTRVAALSLMVCWHSAHLIRAIVPPQKANRQAKNSGNDDAVNAQ